MLFMFVLQFHGKAKHSEKPNLKKSKIKTGEDETANEF